MAEKRSKKETPDLPVDILSLIFTKIHLIGDRAAARSVSRQWNQASRNGFRIPPPLPPPNSSPYRDFPCLMIPQANSSTWKLFHSVYNDSYYLDLPELAGTKIRYSNFRWLLVSGDSNNTAFFFNPFTRRKLPFAGDRLIDLGVRGPALYSPLCFDFPPERGKDAPAVSRVYGFYSAEHPHGYGFTDCTYIPELNAWVRNNSFDGLHLDPPICSPVMVKESIYHLDKSGKLTVVTPPTPSWESWEYARRVRYVTEPGKRIRDGYLVQGKIETEIWGVFVLTNDNRMGDDDRPVRVMKLVRSRENPWQWVEVEDIGDYCMYVSPVRSFARSSQRSWRGMKNVIFFNYFHGKSGVLYSLVTGKFHDIESGVTWSDSAELTLAGDNSAWIQMDGAGGISADL